MTVDESGIFHIRQQYAHQLDIEPFVVGRWQMRLEKGRLLHPELPPHNHSFNLSSSVVGRVVSSVMAGTGGHKPSSRALSSGR